MTIRIIHSQDHLIVEVNRLRTLHRMYAPSAKRDRLRREVHNLVQSAIDQGVIQLEERGLYMGPAMV